LSRSGAPLAQVASGDHPLFVPVVSIAYSVTIAVAVLAIDELADYMPGGWFAVLGAAVLLLSLITIALLLRTAWRRHRERLDSRSLLWASGAAGAAVLAAVAVFGLVENAQIASVISGADVHLTQPVIESLPRPPGAKLVDEQPGLADTESISEDFTAQDLKGIVPFYETALVKQGWVEDKASAGTSIVRFTKGAFVLSVAIDQPTSAYTLTVDRISPNLQQSPSPPTSPTP
jgi:hypothetical protein